MKRSSFFLLAASATITAVLLASCVSAKTYQPSGFLEDYDQLRPALGDTALLRYVKEPDVLKRYDKVIVEPIVIWYRADADYKGISPYELKEMADYFRNSILAALDGAYPVVEEAGPNVLRVRAAITGVTPMRPAPGIWANSPATYVHAKLRSAAARNYSVLQATLEAELLDSQTDERLTAVVDSRAGSEVSPGQPQWKSVTEAFDDWASRLRRVLDDQHSKGPIEPKAAG